MLVNNIRELGRCARDEEDTALGRYKANRKQDLMNSIDDLSAEERQALWARLLEVESESSNQEMEVSNQETEADTLTDKVAELGEQLSSMASLSRIIWDDTRGFVVDGTV